MILVFFIYGLAFFVLGLSVAVYPKKDSAFKFAETLRFIAAFGILHGLNEWVDMAIFIQAGKGTPFIQESRNILLAASFYCLFLFGVRTISKIKKKFNPLGSLPLVLLVSWGVLVVISEQRFLMADIWGRYLLGFPGASLTFSALWMQATDIRETGLSRPVLYLRIAAITFLVYSLITGLVVPEAGFFPASAINYRLFADSFGVPVQVFRAICAVVIAYCMYRMLEIFDWENRTALKEAHTVLEKKVEKKTESLIEANEELEQEIAERRRAEKALVDDIAERKVVEERLRKAQQSLQKMLEAIPYGVILVAMDKEIRFINDAALKFTGYESREEVLGKTCHSTLCPSEVDKCPIIDLGQKIDMSERKARKKTQEIVPILKSVVPITLDGEDLLLEAFVDITELKRTEDALNESEVRQRALLNAMPDIMFRLNSDGVFVDYKPARDFEPLAPADSFLGESINEVMPPEVAEKGIRNLRRALETGQEQTFEYELLVEGETRHYEARIVKSGAEEVLAIVRDITDHWKLEEQLRHAQKMEALGTLTGGIAHEFNNILTAILGYGEFLQDGLDKDHPLRNYADMITTSALRASKLTDGLLAYSRKQITRLEPADINDIIRTTERYFSSLVGEDVTLKVVTTDKDLTVTADKAQIEHVLINLSTNALDAMPKGGRLTICSERVEVRDRGEEYHAGINEGEYALITVSDTGVGIDEDTREKIFEPFFTTKDVGKGTGLGLSMVYGIVKRHGGHISVDSEPEKGTTFSVYLPLGGDISKNEKPVQSSLLITGTETVLVAEDDKAVRGLITQMLTQAGYTVIEAADGHEAVEKFNDDMDSIDLLLFDLAMPGMDGRSAYEEIRKKRPGVKALFISGYVSDDERAKKIIEEGYTLLSKPISAREILVKIRDALAGRR